MKRNVKDGPGPAPTAPLSRKRVSPHECGDDQEVECLGEFLASKPRPSVANTGYPSLSITFSPRRDSQPPTRSPAATTTSARPYNPTFTTPFKKVAPRPSTTTPMRSRSLPIRVSSASASPLLSPKESQIEKNRKQLSVINFVKWLASNYKKVRRSEPWRANPLPLMWKFLQQPEIFMMLKQKVEEISKNSYLMDTNTTVELFRMISRDVLEKCVEADLRDINMTYDAFLAVLDSEGELA